MPGTISRACDGCTGLLGLASSGLLIAVAVLHWSGTCAVQVPMFYALLQPWLIVQFVMWIVSIVVACLAGCVGICGAAIAVALMA